jgi:hypothetical protein
MVYRLMLILLVMALPVIAQDKPPEKPAEAPAVSEKKPAEEPAALVKARDAYEAKVKAVVDPIKADYLKKLEGMKKDFGAKGDVASALAVEREIKSLTATVSLIGKWDYFNGNTVEILADGTSKSRDGGFPGKWGCLDKKARKYQVIWSIGFIDLILLSPDGTTLTVVSYKGNAEVNKFIAHRMPEP